MTPVCGVVGFCEERRREPVERDDFDRPVVAEHVDAFADWQVHSLPRMDARQQGAGVTVSLS